MVTTKYSQEQNISFIEKKYADMDKKIDTVISEIKEMRREVKDTYATKEELASTSILQDLKNETMSKDINKLNDIINKLAWVVVLAVVGSVIAQVIK